MAKLGQKAKEFQEWTYKNLWANIEGVPKHQNLSAYTPNVDAPPKVVRAWWRPLISQTVPARLKTFNLSSKYVLFGIASVAIFRKTYASTIPNDGVDRKGYVRLPDGRLAQVYPQIDTDLSPLGLIRSAIDSINPVP
eukprot:TRINITY_DN967_c0_g1_i1.p2 TRINITY_DN967_c0_g1~~TRINITY_DN967_c0_g1_i1.p2  ORF type:complete len:145 (-),score=18.06 TRINITY_DN967_c0_g1_i1:35-445(-)